PRLFDLPQDTVGTVAGRTVGLVKGIDRRDAVVEYVQYRDHSQRAGRAVRPAFAKFNQARIDAALQKELRVLVDAVVVHSTAGVAARLIAQVQVIVLGHKTQLEHPRLQVLVACPGPSLASVGAELFAEHPQRHAGAAT